MSTVPSVSGGSTFVPPPTPIDPNLDPDLVGVINRNQDVINALSALSPTDQETAGGLIQQLANSIKKFNIEGTSDTPDRNAALAASTALNQLSLPVSLAVISVVDAKISGTLQGDIFSGA